MEQISGGDRQAFAALLKRYLPEVVRFSARYVGAQEADDVAQETFWRVWAKAALWQPEKGALRSWIYRIAWNLSMDMLRKRPSAGVEDITDDLPANEDLPEQSLQQQQQQREVRQAITQLPERQQLALNLSVYQGLSNRETADVMDVSVDALESLLSRARRALKAQFTGVRPGRE